jgi:hypothetical protein
MLLSQTSLCWKCGNYYLQYPDEFESASWVGFSSKSIDHGRRNRAAPRGRVTPAVVEAGNII